MYPNMGAFSKSIRTTMESYGMELTDIDKKIAELKAQYYNLTEADKLYELRKQFEKVYLREDYLQSKPRIFVYTPTYNRGKVLKDRALKSVMRQTYTNFRYLIVGDCCTDDTESIVNELSDKRVSFFNIPRRAWRYPPTAENHWLAGPVVAANTALKLADGDWIARIDDDDEWVEDHLEVMLETAVKNDFEFVSGNYLEERDGKEYVGESVHLYGDYYRIDFPDGDKSAYNPLIGGTSSIFYRSYLSYFEYNIDCWRKDHNRVNDTDLYVRFGLMGVRMGNSGRVEFYNMPRPGETTIGSDAYKRNVEGALEHFRFD